MRNERWRLSLLFAAICLFLPGAFAHPMGNFSINHYSGIRVDDGKIELTYIIDEAEIPTYQALQGNNLVAQASDPSIAPISNKRPRRWLGIYCLLSMAKRCLWN